MDSKPNSLIASDVRASTQVRAYLQELQSLLLNQFEEIDSKRFRRDAWPYSGGGGGLTCVIEDGDIFERGCVNFSHVWGNYLPAAANAARPAIAGRKFEAMGTSC